MKTRLVTAFVFCLLPALAATHVSATPFYVFVGSADNDVVMRYTDTGVNAPSGVNPGATFVTSGLNSLSGTQSPAVGPDNNLYVTGFGNARVKAYNGTTGASLGGPYGGSWSPTDLDNSDDLTPGDAAFRDNLGTEFVGGRGSVFGSDGRLYHAVDGRSNIIRFQGPTLGSPGTVNPVSSAWSSSSPLVTTFGGPTDLQFSSGGNLFVVGLSNGRVFSFNGATGAYIAPVTNIDGSGFFLTSPFGLAIHPTNGNIYVSDTSDNTVRVFSSTGNGDLLSTINFNSLGANIRDIDFGPDGNLYVADRDAQFGSGAHGRIWKYTGVGSPTVFVTDNQGGLDGAVFLDFMVVPEPTSFAMLAFGTLAMFLFRGRRLGR